MYCCSKLSQENEMCKDIPKGKNEQGPLPFVFKDYELGWLIFLDAFRIFYWFARMFHFVNKHRQNKNFC